MKNFPILYLLILILLITSGCGEYKATLGRPGDEVEENPNDYFEIDGHRLKSGYFRIIANHSQELTGEAKIVKTKQQEYYLFLSENFKIEESDNNMLYISTNPILHSPSDLTDRFLIGNLQSNSGFQYYKMKNEYDVWLDGNLYHSVALYNSSSGLLIGYVHLYETEPYEENLWVRTHSTVY